MFQKLILQIILGIILIGLAGCAEEGGPGGAASSETALVEDQIRIYRDAFANAVGNFDAAGMLAYFDTNNPDSNEVLRITEAGSYYDKVYHVLKDELIEVTEDQRRWHQDTSIQYDLSLVFIGDLTFQIDSSTHGMGSQGFMVHESAAGVPLADVVTDTGFITLEITNLLGTWTITKMIIAYDSPPRANMITIAASPKSSAFGFGTLRW